MLLEYHGLGLLDLRGGRRERELEEQLVRLESGEPIQYVLGSVEWCGMKIGVEPGVLIPRPETEEMVQMLGSRVGKRGTTTRILDLCTGSGCIALAMKQKFPEAYVEGWDISDKALSIAKKNAETLNLDVEFRKVDVLQFKGSSRGHEALNVLLLATKRGLSLQRSFLQGDFKGFSLIISNPPYVCQEEKKEMDRNVLEHEPHEALFVPNDDPLVFYRAIAQIGEMLLDENGVLMCETNRRFGKEVADLLKEKKYRNIKLTKDLFGNDRFVEAMAAKSHN